MQLQPYVTPVQDQLVAAAALGDESARTTAQALAVAAEPAIRLAVLSAVAAAADEITAALLDTPGAPSVSARLDGDDLRIEARSSDMSDVVAAVGTAPEDPDTSARISLRLSEALKARIELAARSNAISVNSWLVRAASTALAHSAPPPRGRFASGAGGSRVTGWING